jgi:phage tail-like protein
VDANGTKFYLVLGKADWGRVTDERGRQLAALWASSEEERKQAEVNWNTERNELTLQPQLFQFLTSLNDRRPALGDRRGSAIDRFGNWYWIDESGREILVNSSGTGNTTHFWRAQDCAGCEKSSGEGEFQPQMRSTVQPLDLRGLAITEDHYLVVGVVEPAGLLVFDLQAGGMPQFYLWPQGVDFAPYDLSPRAGGGVWILDRDFRDANKAARYWALDRYFNVITVDQSEKILIEEQTDDFQPQVGDQRRRSERRAFPTGISLAAASSLETIDAIAIEGLPDDTVLILEREVPATSQAGQNRFSRVYRFHYGKQLGDPVAFDAMLDLIEEDRRKDFQLLAHDFAFAPEHTDENGNTVGDRLYIAASDGNQAFAFNIAQENDQLKLEPLADYFPMRLFEGKALVASGKQVFYDSSRFWIPLIAQRRPRYKSEATIITPAFDSFEPDAVWHRLVIDACIPPETRVEVFSRAANEAALLELTDWQQEPSLYLRGDGSEQPFARQSIDEARHAWELLFQKARGQFLQIKLRLTGDGRNTPSLRALRAHYPRFSYLEHYLPAVYREDGQSASFLDRFLANLEGFYTAIEDKIAAVQLLFDPKSAPSEALDWLAGWFDAALDPVWDERKRRLFIAHAVDFFQYRGTIRGLQMALRLAFEDCVDESLFTETAADAARPQAFRIVEKFRIRAATAIAYGDPPTTTTGPRLLSQSLRWTPEQGRDALNRLFTLALGSSTPRQFSLYPPEDANEQSVWQSFAQATLGFIPTVSREEGSRWQAFLSSRYVNDIQALNAAHATSWAAFSEIALPADMPVRAATLADWTAFLQNSTARESLNRRLWQMFLLHRYQTLAKLNAAYQTHWSSFDEISLPDEVPPGGAPLFNWVQFEGVIIPMHEAAHRFSVVLPIPRNEPPDSPEYTRRLELARRLINLEKPAHTIFDVKFYWAMFRIGFARLGEDTTLASGSRAAELTTPMILDKGHLAESYLVYKGQPSASLTWKRPLVLASCSL